MPKLSVIIASDSHWEHIEDTIESLENQTSDDFEVVFIRPQKESEAEKPIADFCSRAEGRFDVIEECGITPKLFNRGLIAASGEYIMFLTPGDFLPPDSIENFLYAAESRADIITGRFWLNRENSEPGYNKFADAVVLRPEIDRFSAYLPRCHELGCRIFRIRSLQKHNIEFPPVPVMYDYLFFMRAVLSGMKISGTPYGILYRKIRTISDFDIREGLPTKENLQITLDAFKEIEKLAILRITEETGIFEGDEYYIQELLESQISYLIDCFYRRIWLMDDETLGLLKSAIGEMMEKLTDSRKERLKEEHKDISFPFMYDSIQDAANEPTFSFILDVPKGSAKELIDSFYLQTFPFFELFVSESVADSGRAGDRWLDSPNFYIAPDRNFHAVARAHAKSKTIILIKDNTPLDSEVLKATHSAEVPNALKSAIFTKNRIQKRMRTSLKNKGASLKD